MVIDRACFYHPEHYEYGEAFYGSYRSVCYRIGLEPLKNIHWTPIEQREPHVLRAYIWKGPFAFDETPDERKEFRDFSYTEEGLLEAIDWIDSHCTVAPPLKII